MALALIVVAAISAPQPGETGGCGPENYYSGTRIRFEGFAVSRREVQAPLVLQT